MRFRAGKSWAEKLREEKEARARWHPKFAWWPVRVGDNHIWLEWVERRSVLSDIGWLNYYQAMTARVTAQVDHSGTPLS